MSFFNSIREVFTHMRGAPEELMMIPTDMMMKLDSSVKSSGQGSANKTTAHEACVAICLEKYGFGLAPRNAVPKETGYYYWYQPGGTQRKGDFVLFSVENGEKKQNVVIDAKHGALDAIFLNDGWFDPDSIYIISFTTPGGRKNPRIPVCFIGMGRDIATESDAKIMEHIIGIKNELNKSKKSMITSFLKIYFRFANQYSCKQFTSEFNEDRFQKTLSWLAPTV
jgi:hypothetical protein